MANAPLFRGAGTGCAPSDSFGELRCLPCMCMAITPVLRTHYAGGGRRRTPWSAAATLVFLSACGSADDPEPAASCEADLDIIRDLPHDVAQNWKDNDAEAFATVFTDDAELKVPDGTFLHGRDEILEYMREFFRGSGAGTEVQVEVMGARCLTPDVALVHTTGGILLPGETEPPPVRVGMQTWLAVVAEGAWRVTAYQNARINDLGPPGQESICER